MAVRIGDAVRKIPSLHSPLVKAIAIVEQGTLALSVRVTDPTGPNECPEIPPEVNP